MNNVNRKFSLGIWGFALGYFVFYLPYSALIRVITRGLLPGMNGPLSGFELLPSTVIATAVTMPLFITLIGWWKYAGRRKFFGRSIPFPSGWIYLSGIGMAVIIGTTTLSYTFSGVSILLALLLLRGGVLILAPLVDLSFKRRVRWFSWVALALSFIAIAIALADIDNYKMTVIAALTITAYIAGYALRMPCMTLLSKSNDKDAMRRYFVEEQMVALPLLVAIPAIVAIFGGGDIAAELRQGFTTFFASDVIWPALGVGVLYACLSVFGTLIYLDRRENTFCVPLNRSSSLLSGVAATYLLWFVLNQPTPSAMQLASTGFILTALAFLSPLHHFSLHLARFTRAFWKQLIYRSGLTDFSEDSLNTSLTGRVFLFVCSGNTCRSALAEVMGNQEIAARLKIPFDSIQESSTRALSAGLATKPGSPMKPQAEQALRTLGVPFGSHASQALNEDMVDRAETIYCMTEAHRREVIERFPAAAAKTICLDPAGDIDEPTGAKLEPFFNCAVEIQRLVRLRFDEAGLGAHA